VNFSHSHSSLLSMMIGCTDDYFNILFQFSHQVTLGGFDCHPLLLQTMNVLENDTLYPTYVMCFINN
jgi:hypothetical protein